MPRSREEEIEHYAERILDMWRMDITVDRLTTPQAFKYAVEKLWDILDAETVCLPSEQEQPFVVNSTGKSEASGTDSGA